MRRLRRTLITAACTLTLEAPVLAQAQAIKLAGLYELSGPAPALAPTSRTASSSP